MQTIMNDLKAAAGLFVDMRKARKCGGAVRLEKKIQVPVFQSGGFYNTVEGCTLSHLSKEVRDLAEGVFNKLSDEEKHRMQFPPKDGEFADRVRFWRGILKPAMNGKQCHIAMCRIIHWYIHIKRMRLGKEGCRA